MDDIATTDRRELEELVVGNEDFRRLEEALDPINIFEAVGVTRQEIRHSKFLAYLLDPGGNHGLGTRLTQHLLQTIVRQAEQPVGISAIDLDLWNLDAIEVRREWRSIDILLLDHSNHFAVIIENKIGSGEHGNQLDRYWTDVQVAYPGWKIIGLVLSPDAFPASDVRYFAGGLLECLRSARDVYTPERHQPWPRDPAPHRALHPNATEARSGQFRSRRALPANLHETPPSHRPHHRTPARPPSGASTAIGEHHQLGIESGVRPVQQAVRSIRKSPLG